MPQLPSLNCPDCRKPMQEMEGIKNIPVARKYGDCLRRCESCEIGASNSVRSQAVTYIHLDPIKNIPIESREGASEALSKALNVRNRESKRIRFGFSTSEDAVTWVVFTYLLHSGQLLAALRRVGLVTQQIHAIAPALLLWGVPVGDSNRGAAIRSKLSDLCVSFHESPNSFSEPNVIIDLEDAGLIFIEVKYRSGNDFKLTEYQGWSNYEPATQLVWSFEQVKGSGCYELARNWCLLKGLAGNRNATLANLGPDSLFSDAASARLDRFVEALGDDVRSKFVKIRWSDFLRKDLGEVPDWFAQYCGSRRMIA